jgi:tetratricopeptide (TPR) repeat protein
LFALPLVLGLAAWAQSPVSPAERQIAMARKTIAANPKSFDGHNALALGLARRARETSDPAYYDQAEEAIKESLRLSPENLEAQRLRIRTLLGKHEFAKALESAKALNQKIPDDVLIYGFLADAHVELGNYKDAEESAQWMLDMRPGNIPALTRAAYLRELFGDIEGAIELVDQAYQRTPPAEVEERAWLLTQLGHLQLAAGKVELADKLLETALSLFPKYHYALANLANVRIAQGKPDAAAELLRQRYEAAPHPENLYALADALRLAGRREEAGAAFLEFETKARAEMKSWDNSNRELIAYYVDRAGKPAEALRVAETEIARRRDIHTLDSHAWALSANGRHEEARRQIEKAIGVGTKDASILFHAAVIASRAGDNTGAQKYYRDCLAAAPSPEIATAARKALGRASTR